MKLTKKLLISALSALWLLMLFTVPAHAACEHKNVTYAQMNPGYNAHVNYHVAICQDCGLTYWDDDTEHTWKTVSYAKPKVPKNPVVDVTQSSAAATDHTVTLECTACGFRKTDTEKHTFKGNTCTKCKLNKGILSKVSSLKGKQKGKVKHKVVNVKGQYLWTGNTMKWMSGRKVDTYTYQATVSWKKNSKAYGYYWTLDKSFTSKSGKYLTNQDTTSTGGRSGLIKKTSTTFTVTAQKKLKSYTFYVAPVSKYGYVGKFNKVAVKLK